MEVPIANNNPLKQTLDGISKTVTENPMPGKNLTPDEKAKLEKQKLENLTKEQQAANQAADAQKKMQVVQDNLSGIQSSTPTQTMAKAKVFNLKEAQFQEQSMEPQPEMGMESTEGGTGEEMPVFTDGSDVKDWLEQIGDPNKAIQILNDQFAGSTETVTDPDSKLSDDVTSVIKDVVNDFYSTPDEQIKLDAASTLFDTIFPEGSKGQHEGEIPADFETDVPATIASSVIDINNFIKKLATDAAKNVKKASSFNLNKYAQHQSVRNMFMFGPEQTHIDAFTGQLISDWHLVERNKGFGLKVDDVLDIDFESIWRGTIMDKYSRPYRDKDGNWVGGYIEARFEVDKNIPPLNNMQLKPGEKRRITPPAYGVIEGRLEEERTAMNKDRGYDPSNKGKPFNWKTASKKKIEREAQLKPMQDIKPVPELKLPGEKTINTNPSKFCAGCHGELEEGSSICPNCGYNSRIPLQGKPKTAPDKAKPENFTVVGSNEPDLSAYGGIFFDGDKFICYAKKKKRRFDSYEEAEKFHQMPGDPSGAPGGDAAGGQQGQSPLKSPRPMKEVKELRQKEKDSMPEQFHTLPASPTVNPGTMQPTTKKGIPSDPEASVHLPPSEGDELGF